MPLHKTREKRTEIKERSLEQLPWSPPSLL